MSVSPPAFAPYAFVCWLTPIIVAIYGYANITMDKIVPESENAHGLGR